MKIKRLLPILLPILLLMASCKENRIYVSSVIADKWYRQWVQVVIVGKVTTSIPRCNYYLQFNELKPYTKEVSYGDYEKFDVGDVYTFAIRESEKDCFFADNITKENEA